jgi:glycosyltransferase involved in cell wall biosynthesis
MSELPGVSIVIGNYNYGRFVAAAIDSALAQDHPRCEVIVVDDGSSDGSQEVIERYRDRARIILLPSNRGQVGALNEAWPLAQYEVVVFLDSDDMLEPSAASTIARNWAPEVAKIQFPVKSIDADGRSLNHVWPKYPAELTTETIRRMLLATGQTYTSPCSGNAYSQWLLQRMSPIGGDKLGCRPGRPDGGQMDALTEIHAPFEGEVKTLTTPLTYYRMHGSNYTQHYKLDVERFTRQLQDFDRKLAYLARFLHTRGIKFDPEVARTGSLWYLECQVAVSRLSAPSGRWYVQPRKVLGHVCKAFFRSPASLRERAAVFLWITLGALAPQRWAERLLELRFNVNSRPKWLEPVLSRLIS